MTRRRVLVRTCRQCGQEYHPTRPVQTYCSPNCRWTAERERNLVAAQRICRCGRSFTSPPSGQRYCSISCGVTTYHARSRKPRERPCAQCGQSFVPYPSALVRAGGKFCSRACYYAAAAVRPAMVETVCTNCGGKFSRTRAAVRRVDTPFCSRLCHNNWQVGPNSPLFRSGRALAFGPGWRRRAEEIRERDGRRCLRCGATEQDEGRHLAIDHLIPRRAFESVDRANDPANLASLCGSCHAWKTRGPERRWLLGDALDLVRFIRSIGMEPVLA